MDKKSLQQVILYEFPYPVAVNYRRMLEETNWQSKTDKAIRVFDYALRMVAIGLTSQYLSCDAEAIGASAVNRILRNQILGKKPSLGVWKGLLFSLLDAYHGKRERLFMPELYDTFWDTSTSPHQKRPEVRHVFEHLVQIRNEVIHGAPPRDEAGWEGLNRAVLEMVHKALEHLTCLKDYDLIRIVDETEVGTYTYELYKGQEVEIPPKPLHHEEKLAGEWAYVSQDRERLLELHPWLLFWQDPVKDAALFDHFSTDLLYYLATVSGVNATIKRHADVIVPSFGLAGRDKEIVDEAAIKEFVELVYDTVIEIEAERETAERLTWPILKRKAFHISAQRMGDAQSKYSPQLHYRRTDIEDVFNQFLASDKIGLVLVGESGVGKSHFILRQRRRLRDDPHICTLVYRGTYLDTERPLSQVITNDFNQFLRLTEGARRKITDIFVEINEIPNIEVRDVVLFFDGINESPEAKRLLRQIDKLIQDLGFLEWLKVVVTCRPETWRTIKRGLSLAKHLYYKSEGQEELSIELKRFSKEETVKAYRKYQQVYDLQTLWEDIPREMRETLQQPLYMWLVSKTYEGGTLPSEIKQDQIFVDYIQALLDTGRLENADLAFLRHDLMPLMINESRYDNTLSGDTLTSSQSRDGRPMSELIQNYDRLRSGRRINQAFFNLCNAGILTKQELIGSYEIGFQYEGFYEYFGGKRLFQVHKDKSEEQKIIAYQTIFGRINEKPYLWGVLKRALKSELSELKSEYLLKRLCYTEDPMIQDLLVATLREFGREYSPATVTSISMALLKENVDATDLRNRTAKRIAIRAARHLELLEVLRIAALSSSESVRTIAAQESYYLWRDNTDKGVQLLTEMSGKVRGRIGIPQLSIIEFCTAVSLPIIFGQVDNKESLSLLQNIWDHIIEGVGLVPKKGNFLSKLLQAGGSQAALHMLLRLPRISKNMRWEHPFNVSELSTFFDLPWKEKEAYRNLIPYLRPDQTKIEDAEKIIRQVASHRDMLSMYLLELVLLSHFEQSRDKTVQALELAFDIGINMNPPGPAMQYALFAFAAFGCYEKFTEELARKYLDMALDVYARTGGRYQTATDTEYTWIAVPHAIFHFHSATDSLPSELDDFLDTILSGDFQPLFLKQFTVFVDDFAIQYQRFNVKINTAFHIYILILEKLDNNDFTPSEKSTTRSYIVASLANLRLYHPNEVEDFLATQQFSDKEVIQIRNKAVETIGEILVRDGAHFAVQAMVTESFAKLSDQIIWLLEQAAYYKKASRWLNIVLKCIVNVVYSKIVFDIGMPYQ